MANFEAPESRVVAENKIAPSNLFNDAYNYVAENPGKSAAALATGVVAVGALIATRGRSAMRESLNVAEHAALPQVSERLALAAPVREAAINPRPLLSSLESPAERMPAGLLRDRLTAGAAIGDRPQYMHQIQLGLPRNMDLPTARRLETAMVTGDKAAVTSTMDEIFGAPSTYAQMRRSFGG